VYHFDYIKYTVDYSRHERSKTAMIYDGDNAAPLLEAQQSPRTIILLYLVVVASMDLKSELSSTFLLTFVK
jgi:hypothetical protein